ncbi:uncharacterized protein LOC128240813 isoform X3 [Mya arenaria]|uniref:uncharacterized protein LOC128240813 isoform X3 n=1 Tax=Mya arenaria TaxID=6604 RepID=UPI0022E3CB9B|nr:uncharacterized protein LOC128240813 isoform X3 [Mya arenaria]
MATGSSCSVEGYLKLKVKIFRTEKIFNSLIGKIKTKLPEFCQYLEVQHPFLRLKNQMRPLKYETGEVAYFLVIAIYSKEDLNRIRQMTKPVGKTKYNMFSSLMHTYYKKVLTDYNCEIDVEMEETEYAYLQEHISEETDVDEPYERSGQVGDAHSVETQMRNERHKQFN